MRMEESASAEAQKPDRPKNPNRHSLLARLRAVGIEDAVMAALEAGQTLRAVHDIITARELIRHCRPSMTSRPDTLRHGRAAG